MIDYTTDNIKHYYELLDKNYSIEKEIKNLNIKFNDIKAKNWVQSLSNGKGAIGDTFERLLGKKKDSFELPDYNGIELKVKNIKRHNFLRLFSAVPDSYILEIQRLYDTYGYTTTKNNTKHFYICVNAKYFKIIGDKLYKLKVDEDNKNIVFEIYSKEKKLIDNYSKWSYDLLSEKLQRKLNYLAIIDAQKKTINSIEYFKYEKIHFYRLRSFEKFIELIKDGKIYVEFKISTYKSGNKIGQLYSHGVEFSLINSSINKLFEEIKL